MIRTLTAVGLSVAIPLGALSAPLVHVHPDDLDTDHHHGPEIHAHIAGHASSPAPVSGRQFDDHESDRAVSLQLFVAMSQTSFEIPAAVVPSWELEAPAEAAARPPLRIVHGHDPPFPHSLGSRAPPAFSVLI